MLWKYLATLDVFEAVDMSLISDYITVRRQTIAK